MLIWLKNSADSFLDNALEVVKEAAGYVHASTLNSAFPKTVLKEPRQAMSCGFPKTQMCLRVLIIDFVKRIKSHMRYEKGMSQMNNMYSFFNVVTIYFENVGYTYFLYFLNRQDSTL